MNHFSKIFLFGLCALAVNLSHGMGKSSQKNGALQKIQHCLYQTCAITGQSEDSLNNTKKRITQLFGGECQPYFKSVEHMCDNAFNISLSEYSSIVNRYNIVKPLHELTEDDFSKIGDNDRAKMIQFHNAMKVLPIVTESFTPSGWKQFLKGVGEVGGSATLGGWAVYEYMKSGENKKNEDSNVSTFINVGLRMATPFVVGIIATRAWDRYTGDSNPELEKRWQSVQQGNRSLFVRLGLFKPQSVLVRPQGQGPQQVSKPVQLTVIAQTQLPVTPEPIKK